MNLRKKITLLFLLAAFIPFVVIGSLAFLDTREVIQNQVIKSLNSVATIQKNRLLDYIDTNTYKLDLVTHDRLLDQLLYQYERTKSTEIQKQLTASCLDTKNRATGIQNIQIVDPKGIDIVSTDPSQVGKNYLHDPLFMKGIQKDDISILRKDSKNKVSEYLTGPVKINNQLIAVVVLQIPADELYDLFKDYTGLGKTGEWGLSTHAPNGDGLVIVPGRFNLDPNSPLTKTLDRKMTKAPITQALRGNESTFTDLVNYRGTPVLASTRYIPQTDWAFAVTLPQSEAYAPIANLIDQAIFYIGLILLSVILLSSVVSQIIVIPILKLTKAAKQVAEGNLLIAAKVSSHDEIGKLAEIFNFMTEKLQTSYRQVEEAKAKDDAILDSIGEGLILVDIKGSITLINKTAEKLFGVKSSELLGKGFFEHVVLVNEERKNLSLAQRPLTIAMTEGKIIKKNEYACIRSDSLCIPVTVIATPIFYKDKVIGGIEIFHDRTKEEEVDEAKDEFVSIAAHQLRTPLGTMRWQMESLFTRKLPKKLFHTIEDMYESNLRLITLVNDLLDVSRINQQKIIYIPQKINILKIIEDVVEQVKFEAKKKAIIIKLVVPKISHEVCIDPKLVRQVFQNIIMNAITYNRTHGSIRISIEKYDKKELLIKIADTGIGIPKKDQDKIFDKFHRAENVTKLGIEGTGLGLFVVKSYVKYWKGKVWVDSEEGKGTTVSITIPEI